MVKLHSSNDSTNVLNDILFMVSEMAERHDMLDVLKMARNLVHQLQTIIEDK